MGSRAHGKNSSSQNDKLYIRSLEKGGTRGGLIKLSLSDGSSFFILKEILLNESLYQGCELSMESISRLKEKSEEYAVCKKALSLLARTLHSTKMLKFKLLKRGFKPQAIDRVLKGLTEQGQLDDLFFAEEWLRMRLERHPEGRTLLISGLIKRGVGKDVAEHVTDTVFTLEVEQECARRLIEKLEKRSKMLKQELSVKLSSRRFRFQVIRDVLAGIADSAELD